MCRQQRCELELRRRAQQVADGDELLERAHAVGAAVPQAELRRRGVQIDDDHLHMRLQQGSDALRAAAERFDARGRPRAKGGC